MIEIIKNIPGNTAGFRAIGEVDADDYKKILAPELEALLKNQDKINFLLVLENSITDFTAGALLQDIGVGLKHFTKWRKMAIVSDSEGINKFTDFFSYIAPGEARGFPPEELTQAIEWVST